MDTIDLYATPIPFGAFARPCGCNQGTNNRERCVLITEIPGTGGGVALMDSKHPERGDLRFSRQEWTEFLAHNTLV